MIPLPTSQKSNSPLAAHPHGAGIVSFCVRGVCLGTISGPYSVRRLA
jgi:hypothetical protein